MDSRDQSATEAASGAIRMHLFATTAWGQTHCWCQRDTISADFGMDFPEHIEHVAAVVVQALGVDEEWGVRRALSNGGATPRESEEWCRTRAAFLNDRCGDGEAWVVRRSVGPWVSVSGKCGECGKGIGHFLTCSQHPDNQGET